MKSFDIAKFFVAHVIAAGVYFILFLAVPAVIGALVVIVLFVSGIITGDMGGPLFLPGVLVVGLIYALYIFVLGLIIFLVTAGIQILGHYIKISVWVPIALAPLVVFTIIVMCGLGGIAISLAVSAAFCVYWLSLSGSNAIMCWIRKNGNIRGISNL